jgi:hypothetical protein
VLHMPSHLEEAEKPSPENQISSWKRGARRWRTGWEREWCRWLLTREKLRGRRRGTKSRSGGEEQGGVRDRGHTSGGGIGRCRWMSKISKLYFNIRKGRPNAYMQRNEARISGIFPLRGSNIVD